MVDKIVFLQFGTGRFIRGYFDWMLSKLTQNIEVIALQSTEQNRYKILKERNYKYKVFLKHKDAYIDEVSVIKDVLPIYQDISLISKIEEKVDFIVSNTSEKGIQVNQNQIEQSYPFKLAYFLYNRYSLKLNDNITIVPLELVNNNGLFLKDKVLEISHIYYGENFANWVNKHCEFVNTVVDCIVDNEMENLDVERENYYAFFSTKNSKLENLFSDSKLNVVFNDNIEKIFEIKVKVLNGLHTFLVCTAYIEGENTVYEAVCDTKYKKMLDEVFFEEIIHTIDYDKSFVEDFYLKTIERFKNPALKHYLKDIAVNTYEKFFVRLGKTIVDYQVLFGKEPTLLNLAFNNLKKIYPNNANLEDFDKYYESFKK
jgi:tagaturonate reductase